LSALGVMDRLVQLAQVMDQRVREGELVAALEVQSGIQAHRRFSSLLHKLRSRAFARQLSAPLPRLWANSGAQSWLLL